MTERNLIEELLVDFQKSLRGALREGSSDWEINQVIEKYYLFRDRAHDVHVRGCPWPHFWLSRVIDAKLELIHAVEERNMGTQKELCKEEVEMLLEGIRLLMSDRNLTKEQLIHKMIYKPILRLIVSSLESGRLYVPLRDVARALLMALNWFEGTRMEKALERGETYGSMNLYTEAEETTIHELLEFLHPLANY